MPRRLLAALVVLAATAGAGTAAVSLKSEEPVAKRYGGSAAAVVAGMRDGGLDCRPLPSAGKYGGTTYARCELSPGDELAVWTAEFPAQPRALQGLGWRVYGSRAGLERAQAALGGDLRETPVAVRYGVRYTGGPLMYDDAKAKADIRPCLNLPGVSLEMEYQSLPPSLGMRLDGTEAEQTRLDECLRGLPTSTKVAPPARVDGGWSTSAMQHLPVVSGPFPL